jgi:hypothetical protein
MVASVPSLELQVPPPDASLNDVVKPTHTLAVPAIAPGNGLTVTTDVILQPVGSKYVIVAVPEPAAVTIPEEEPMVAIAPLLLLHIPLAVASVNDVADPRQT